MNKGFAVIIDTVDPGCATGSNTKWSLTSKKVSNHNLSHRGQSRGWRGLARVITRSQESREHSLSTAPTSNVTPRSHHRRWSADFCKCDTSPVIIVRKIKKEPQPPQRSISLPTSHTASKSSIKRYSCPPTGISDSPSQLSLSSSSSISSSTYSSTSSCSSPPPTLVQTSVITGHDPLGWKLRPKSRSTSPRANRLSLQIPLPVTFPVLNSQLDNTPTLLSPKTKPPLRPKPSCRRHSDSSAFLKSLEIPVTHVVTLEELSAVLLHPLTLSDESDVFSEGSEEQVKVTTQPHKIPPPVPDKTTMARQIAQLIARSRQYQNPVTTKSERIYASIIKPHKTVDHGSLHATKTAELHQDTSSTPRFPGREI